MFYKPMTFQSDLVKTILRVLRVKSYSSGNGIGNSGKTQWNFWENLK